MSGVGTTRTFRNVSFSNRPFGVKRLQTIHRCSVDVAHGLVLLFGIGTKALVWGFFSQEVLSGGVNCFPFIGFVRSILKSVSFVSTRALLMPSH